MLLDPATQQLATTTTYLGPGEVLDARGLEFTVRLRDDLDVTARLALAFPYAPAVGDLLLIIGQGDEHYIIGVLQGAGTAVLSMQGDVSIRAVDGTLELLGDRGVRVLSPEVEIHTGKFKLLAETITEKATTVYRWVKNLLTMRAGRKRDIVDSTSYSRAYRQTILAEEHVKINGEQVHLG